MNAFQRFLDARKKHVEQGRPQATKAVRIARLQACKDCDSRAGVFCMECSCVIALKSRWADQDCPLGKWGTAVLIQPQRGNAGGCCGG